MRQQATRLQVVACLCQGPAGFIKGLVVLMLVLVGEMQLTMNLMGYCHI